MTATTTAVPSKATSQLAAFTLAGAVVAVALGTYGSVHDPTGRDIFHLGFSGMPNMKIWLGSGALALGVFQVVTASWMWGRLPGVGERPAWLGPVHRWSGTLAFVLTVPVAYHCLWAIGFNNQLAGEGNARRLIHSLAGCAFYGAFTTKMLALRTRRLPGWTLPVLGGLLFTLLVAAWATSSLWWFTTVDFPDF